MVIKRGQRSEVTAVISWRKAVVSEGFSPLISSYHSPLLFSPSLSPLSSPLSLLRSNTTIWHSLSLSKHSRDENAATGNDTEEIRYYSERK